MGLIFDKHIANRYEAWRLSPQGRAMEALVEESILSFLRPMPGERVLDIGCGTGNHLMYFSRLGLDITGIDASPLMINRAKERLGNRCHLKACLAEDLPFDDNEFDLAVLINTIEFLDDPVQALREAGRVANRRVFIGVMNRLSPYCLSNRLKGLFRETLLSQARFYSLWGVQALMRKALGPVPILWKGSQSLPVVFHRFDHWPFGSFLGLAAPILYRVKTDNIPLKVRMSKVRESIANGIIMGNQRPEKGGIQGEQRGLSL